MTIPAALSEFAQSILALCLPILAAYLARELKAWLEQSAASMRSRANADTRYLLDDAAVIAVRAAEQVGGSAAKKLEFALDLAGSYLRHHGVELDLPTLRGLVEAAVKAEFGKPASPPLLRMPGGVTATPVVSWTTDTAPVPEGQAGPQ